MIRHVNNGREIGMSIYTRGCFIPALSLKHQCVWLHPNPPFHDMKRNLCHLLLQLLILFLLYSILNFPVLLSQNRSYDSSCSHFLYQQDEFLMLPFLSPHLQFNLFQCVYIFLFDSSIHHHMPDPGRIFLDPSNTHDLRMPSLSP